MSISVTAAPVTATTATPAPFRVGSEEHKQAFCSVLLDLFDPYKPSILAWPVLSNDAKQRLTGLPFWDVAVETEGFAASRMQAMADTIKDPLIREALTLNAFEEGRHKLVLRNMLRFYGIPLKAEIAYSAPKNAENMFLRTGYGECLDSFFAFGLYKMAKDSGFFPPELVEVFEPVVHEESRHIMFFINWVAYTAAQKALLPRLWFRIRCLWQLAMNGVARLSLAGVVEPDEPSTDFLTSGAKELTQEGLSVNKLLRVALAENDRRMARFDPRLLRPKLMPFIGRMLLKLLPASM